MPIIGSLEGTFGHGRSPQIAPPAGFTFYPKISNKSTWVFTANGVFSFNGNIGYSTNSSNPDIAQGNAFVIIPTTTFIANVKMWGAGGGSGGNVKVDEASVIQGGAGGAAYGQI